MGEKLCLKCIEEGRSVCLIEEKMRILQSKVPEVADNEKNLEIIQRLNMEEKEIHELGRKRGCHHHNDFTLSLPRFELK
ncbi:hypothetical protein KKD37_04505 [Patescibacteria group bacterium]|nr:hypothetical protein [Patescibacteria group bacterium]